MGGTRRVIYGRCGAGTCQLQRRRRHSRHSFKVVYTLPKNHARACAVAAPLPTVIDRRHSARAMTAGDGSAIIPTARVGGAMEAYKHIEAVWGSAKWLWENVHHAMSSYFLNLCMGA